MWESRCPRPSNWNASLTQRLASSHTSRRKRRCRQPGRLPVDRVRRAAASRQLPLTTVAGNRAGGLPRPDEQARADRHLRRFGVPLPYDSRPLSLVSAAALPGGHARARGAAPLPFGSGIPGPQYSRHSRTEAGAKRRETTMPPRRVLHTVRQAPSSYPHSEEPKRMRKTSSRSVAGACGNPTGAPVQIGASRSSGARGSSIPSRTRSSGASGLGRQAR